MSTLPTMRVPLLIALLSVAVLADSVPLPVGVVETSDRFEQKTTFTYDGGSSIGFGTPSYDLSLIGVAHDKDPSMNLVMIVMTRKFSRAGWNTDDLRKTMVMVDGADAVTVDRPAYTSRFDTSIGRVVESVGFSLPQKMLPDVLDATHKAEFRVGDKEFLLSDSTRTALHAIAYRLRLPGVAAPTARQQFNQSAEAVRLRQTVFVTKAALDGAREAALGVAHDKPAYRVLSRRCDAASARLTTRVVGQTRRDYEEALNQVKAEMAEYDREAVAQDQTVAAKQKDVDAAEAALRNAEFDVPPVTPRP